MKIWPISVVVVSLIGCGGPAGDAPAAESAARECEAVAVTLRGVPGAEVTRSNGTFDDPIAGRPRTGCHVAAKGTFGALRDTPGPETRVGETLRGRGLTEDLRYAADGPDGTSFALGSKTVLCIVGGRWDGGDDSDPTYVPGDWYEITVDCAPDGPGKSPGQD